MTMRNLFIGIICISLITACNNEKSRPAKQSEVKTFQSARIYLTAKNTGDRLADKGTVKAEPLPQPDEQMAVLFVDPEVKGQAIEGIGGALTDAAAETFYKLPPEKQQELIRAYYDPEKGIGYSLGRTNINSCDFSSDSYTYVAEGDSSLSTFSLEHDLKYKIPLIKEVLKAAPSLKLFASPWSPPAWMKSNNDMLHGGSILPQYMHSWARYYVKFVEEYAKQGINIWGLTVQNEPMAVQTWESCIYTAEQERDFVKNFLGPELHKAGLANLRLMVWDHNRGLMYQRAKTVLDDPEAAKYVWGVGFHWYVGNHFDNVRLVKEAYPDKQVLFTEGCGYPFDWKTVTEWKWGEEYALNMIHDLNNGACGWTDWNILLDEKGGPNHVGNYCLAPVIADTRDGSLHYMDSYWYIGHISKFVRPGAIKVLTSSTQDDLPGVSFVNPDGKLVVVILNTTESVREVGVWIAGSVFLTSMPERSIATLVF